MLCACASARASPAWKRDFGSFWPEKNHFYGPLTGIEPGDVAVLNLPMPGRVKLSTGIFVMYADDESFTFMTLRNVAERFGVEGDPETQVVCVDRRRQWRRAGNIRHSATIRSGLYAAGAPFRMIAGGRKKDAGAERAPSA